MEHLTKSIEKSIVSENWHGALATSLMIPDICCYISDGKQGNGKKYAGWFDAYIGQHYKTSYPEALLQQVLKHSTREDYENLKKQTNFSGNDCYALRCAYLHQGLGDITKQRAREILDEVVFVEPINSVAIHGSIINNKLVLHIDSFCKQILEGISTWKVGLNSDQLERFNEFLLVKNIFEVAKYC